MIDSPFAEEVHYCKSSMKKLRKKIYKFNINKQLCIRKEQSTMKDALSILMKRNVPNFLLQELQKYSDLTFSSLSGFSLDKVQPLTQISQLTINQEKQIENMYKKTKKNLRKRRCLYPLIKLERRVTTSSSYTQRTISSTNIQDDFERFDNSDISSNQESLVFQPIENQDVFDQEFHNNDAMFQSTMLDFGNEIDMDSEQFLFKC